MKPVDKCCVFGGSFRYHDHMNTGDKGPCTLCGEAHRTSTCPEPLKVPRTPRRKGEADDQYHARLRKNAYQQRLMARRLSDPELRAATNAKSRERAKSSPNSPSRVARRQHHARCAEWLAGLKDQPCLDCHRAFPSACMQFDHRPGEVKLFNIGANITRPRQVVLDEIAKCDLICANCHAIRTASRVKVRLKSRVPEYKRPR